MKRCDNNDYFTISGTIDGSGEIGLPVLQDAERTGSFAVSLSVKMQVSGCRIYLCGEPVETGILFTVKHTADTLYRVVEHKVMQFETAVSQLVKQIYSVVERTVKTFRRVRSVFRMYEPVLLSRAGGLRL